MPVVEVDNTHFFLPCYWGNGGRRGAYRGRDARSTCNYITGHYSWPLLRSRGARNGVDPAVHYSIPANQEVRATAAAQQRWGVATYSLSIKNCSHCMLFEADGVLEACADVFLTWLRVVCAVRGGDEKEFLAAVLLHLLQSRSSNH